MNVLFSASFVMASPEELEQNNDDCAICWEKMEMARKLPCGHLFHKYGLQKKKNIKKK